MRKSLASLLLATAPALMLSACNSAGSSNGLSAMPSVAHPTHGKVRPDDFSSNDLHAGGATFPAYAYNLGIQPAGCALTGCSSTSPGAPPALPQAPPGKGSLFAAAHTTGTIYYCLTGSGTGRKVFEGGQGFEAYAPCAPLGASPTGFGARVDPPDFAGSDVAMASTEYTSFYKPNRETGSTQWGEPFEFPVVGGPIIYGYRAQDFRKTLPGKKIRFSTWTYCAIANGTISDWNDPAITADNGGKSVTGGVSRTITFYFRSDGSGTSFNYTTHLQATCGSSWPGKFASDPYQDVAKSRNAAWTYGASQTWAGPGTVADPNPNFIGESGNPGVLAAIQSTPFSTGYLEGAWARSANPPVDQALLQSNYPTKGNTGAIVYVDPTDKAAVAASFKNVTASAIQYGGGSDGLSLTTTRPDCILYIDAATTLQAAPFKAYPIIAVSYLLFYGNNNGVHVADKKKLINFMISKKANQILSNLEYTPLSSGIQQDVSDALNGKGHSTSPCLQ